jgi:hypothetical protein
MVALITAGCSNAPAETGTGSSGGNNTAAPAETGTGSSGGNNTAATHEQAVKFAECMRDNGVREFPDPTENGPLINVEHARSKPGLEAAVDKCRDVLTGGLGGQQ